jgi:hypothetical protein
MDIVAHALWAGAGTALAARRFQIEPRTVIATMAFAALPDLLQFLPIFGWVLFGDGSWTALVAHAIALPGHEPVMPPVIALTSYHLHCIAHSAVVATALSAVMWIVTRSLWIPLLGWWSHIVIDVFTHSADFYPAPVFYPISHRAFDGIAWNEPWFMALNYTTLGVVCVWAVRSCATSSRSDTVSRTMDHPRHRSGP